jgi:activator of HSP90 ATPase
MSESITVKFSIHAPAKAIYDAWLSAAEHTAMTGAKATASKLVGGSFTAWDGYISGKNLLLLDGKKIVQSWRSSEFPEEASDSVLSVLLIENNGITEVDIEHKDIPPGQGVQYQSGWIEFYANPMQKYFAAKYAERKKSARATHRSRKPAKKKAAGKRKAIPKKKLAKAYGAAKKAAVRKKKGK